PSPQAANMADIRWTSKAAGGVGAYTYEFHLMEGKEVRVVHSGANSYWQWKPDKKGIFRVRALVRDSLGNTSDSGWSPEYVIMPELVAETITADRPTPQAANMADIRWTSKAAGGVGAYTYEFHLLKGEEVLKVQSDIFPYWDWKPDTQGRYRVRALVRDSLGNTADSGWSSEYEIVPELVAETAAADKPSPQAANMTSIVWSVKATGGMGPYNYEFHSMKAREDRLVQSGALPYLEWKPDSEGLYRVKAIVRDSLDNTSDSGWSSEYEIVPELVAEAATPDKPSPQAANMAGIRWTLKAAGGAGPLTYEFHIMKGTEDRIVQEDAIPYWDWKPDETGAFRVKAVVRDSLGNTAESGWSPEYEIRKFIKSSTVAVLPVENLSGTKAPAKNIGQLIKTELKRAGFNIIDNDILEEFMLKHRIRYTGAIDLKTAEAFKKEIGVDAVLITSIELYSDLYPPKISLISRLTSTGSRPEIMWMDSAGLSGDDSPGLLGLGLIENVEEILLNAVRSLADRLDADMWGAEKMAGLPGVRKRKQPALVLSVTDSMEKPLHDKKMIDEAPEKPAFAPKIYYRSPVLSPEMKYRVAIMPFLNKSDRRNAGDIMMLHFTEQLREIMNYDVIEPGIVRNNLLGFRIIMNEGVSFENAGFIFSTLETDADLILSGTVLDYQDNVSIQGTPKVDFSVIVIEKKSREVVWSSKSYRTGNEDVIFFDKGQINVAHALASGMARGVTEMLLAE
ncbi:MAG: hypothetical protein C4581_06220, partial [Nitrospiraceae bacterium]